MENYKELTDKNSKITAIETNITGKTLLNMRELNKGSAFTEEERQAFKLIGKLPYRPQSMKKQIERYYEQLKNQPSNLAKNKFLNELKQHNEVLFYKLASQHLAEILPIIYTPTIGDAVENFSYQFNLPQGLYFSYPEQKYFDEILENRINKEIELVIVTDGEGVLGIGDWGIGGMDILIGKLMVYTLCGGINPRHVLPIQLDAGTNNPKLLKDPMYLGWQHPRITGKDYDDFIDHAVNSITKAFPNIFLHWEDFGRDNARRNLNRYREKMCTFNDDMQGTGATALACVLSGLAATKQDIKKQRIILFGAGTAGVGIADQICEAIMQAGLSEEETHRCFWLIDRPGLLTDDMPDLAAFQKPYARSQTEIKNWEIQNNNTISLLDVVKNIQPTILIGCSTVHGAFNQEVIETMSAGVQQPLIFPLSNPTHLSEADPKDIIHWSKGQALTATGSPYDPVEHEGKTIRISQCNNAFIFPGLGLGILAAKAKRVSNSMIAAACHALSQCSPALKNPNDPILPSLNDAPTVSRKIALAVAEQARQEKIAGIEDSVNLKEHIEAIFWEPQYLPYQKIK